MGFIMPQFYLEVGYNDLTVKMGHFAPSIGYEVVAAPGNFFYSHSYALGYSEPVLVTGFQANYKLNDYWNVIGGLNEGFNQFQDEDGKFHFLGGLKWHNDEHKVSVSLMTDIGPEVNSVDPLGINNQYELTAVLKKQVNAKLTYAAETSFGVTEDNSDAASVRPNCQVVGPGPVPVLHDQSVLVGGQPRGVLPRPGWNADWRVRQRGNRGLAGRAGICGHVHGSHDGAELASAPQLRSPAGASLGLLQRLDEPARATALWRRYAEQPVPVCDRICTLHGRFCRALPPLLLRLADLAEIAAEASLQVEEILPLPLVERDAVALFLLDGLDQPRRRRWK